MRLLPRVVGVERVSSYVRTRGMVEAVAAEVDRVAIAGGSGQCAVTMGNLRAGHTEVGG